MQSSVLHTSHCLIHLQPSLFLFFDDSILGNSGASVELFSDCLLLGLSLILSEISVDNPCTQYGCLCSPSYGVLCSASVDMLCFLTHILFQQGSPTVLRVSRLFDLSATDHCALQSCGASAIWPVISLIQKTQSFKQICEPS